MKNASTVCENQVWMRIMLIMDGKKISFIPQINQHCPSLTVFTDIGGIVSKQTLRSVSDLRAWSNYMDKNRCTVHMISLNNPGMSITAKRYRLINNSNVQIWEMRALGLPSYHYIIML